jgi:glycosyltransferase involved in cell wall biosynthesis
VRILTNFTNAPDHLELSGGEQLQIVKADSWQQIRGSLKHADMVVLNCGGTLLYSIARHFLLFPWTRRPLVAVDLVLRRPETAVYRAKAWPRRLLLAQVDHFIHYFRDLSGYTRYFGVRATRSSYVPFKVNNSHMRVDAHEFGEDYILAAGQALRDYDTFIRAVADLPYPAAIPRFSFDGFEGKGPSFKWKESNLPKNLTILPDTGSRMDLVRYLARAKVVVIPTQAKSLCASGLSTYLDAMYLGKCVVLTEGPGASDVLTDQAILVPPHDPVALRGAIARAWGDEALRRKTAAAGKAYAHSLGGEQDLLKRVFSEAVSALPRRRSALATDVRSSE